MRNTNQEWTLQETLIEDLQKLLSLEKAFMMTLPLMAQNATDIALQRELERLTHQTRDQIARLQSTVSSAPSAFIAQTDNEYNKRGIAEPSLLDGLLIAEMRRKQHAKIALYSMVCLWAHQLGLHDLERLLALNLKEEEDNCEKLLQMAHDITHSTSETAQFPFAKA